MASVLRDTRGRDGWRIRFVVGTVRREMLFNGTKRSAEELGRHLDQLAACKVAGTSLDADLKSWIKRMDASIRDRLER